MHTVMTGIVDSGRGCPRRQWINDVKRWTGMSAVRCAALGRLQTGVNDGGGEGPWCAPTAERLPE